MITLGKNHAAWVSCMKDQQGKKIKFFLSEEVLKKYQEEEDSSSSDLAFSLSVGSIDPVPSEYDQRSPIDILYIRNATEKLKGFIQYALKDPAVFPSVLGSLLTHQRISTCLNQAAPPFDDELT